jgi:predicted nucleic acid-binding Zn ribbon protein
VSNRTRKGGFDPLGSLLGQVLGACRKNPDLALHRVWDIWDEALGARIASNARPTAFKGRLLLVSVSSSAWLQQLRFQKAEMIALVNAALGDARVEDIKFKIGAVGDSNSP